MGTMAPTPFRAIATLFLSLLWGLSHAQESEPYEPDPPDRAARLSYLEGDVSMQPAGEEEWAPAIVNRPLTTGDKLWAERDARAEIQVGPAAVRLGSNTGFSFLNVDDDTIQMRISAGVLNVSVRALRDSEHIEIDTPNVALSLLRPGNYRVEVNDTGDTTVVKVSEGAAQATGGSQDVVVHAQQAVTFRGFDNLVAQFGTLGAPDEFDSWNLDRDRRDERAASSRTAEYVAPDVTGYQDLEDNGTWSSEPEYGYVWTPTRVAVGWAPYHYGRWVWVSPWGWTWIDDARWGYAPFHYGRWAHVRNRWCWVPGPRHVRAVYAPALVGWGGAGVHVSWFPLGPREVYVPGRRFSRHYWERVNYANTNVSRSHFNRGVEDGIKDAIYRNRMVPGGVTAVPRSAFTSAGRTRDHRVRLSDQDFQSSVASAVAPRIAPVRESRMGGPVRANVRVPPTSVANRQVVVRRDPPPAAARFARRPEPRGDVALTQAERPAHPQRGPANNRPERSREDRPPRAERPVSESAPHSSVFEPRAIADRVREDRDRQGREGQQQREASQQREALQQRESERSQRWQRQGDQERQQREQSQASRDLQNQLRERMQRQQESERQPAARPVEQRERPAQRVQPVQREQPAQRERSEQRERHVERPQVERPQVERPSRSEAQRPAESRPPPRERQDGNTRSKRD
jgi:hypothetical protein